MVHQCGRRLTAADLCPFASLQLSYLRMKITGSKTGDAGAWALAMLKNSTTLRTLMLDLRGNKVGDAGARALAMMLKNSTTLGTLTLDMRGNRVRDAGAQALAMLKDSTRVGDAPSLLT